MTLWHLHASGLALLEEHVTAHPPRLAVEAGSGDTTLVLARHAERLVTLEHLPFHARAIEQRLTDAHLTAEIRLTTIVHHSTPAGRLPWYAAPLPDGIDFALMDGPPESIGRTAGLFLLWPHLADDFEVWLDDTHRQAEKTALTLWAKYLPIMTEPIDGRLARIRKASA